MTEKNSEVPAMKLQVVPIPVADVDLFYVNKASFNLDFDTQSSETMRIVQLTPPGSACSIMIGTGMSEISEIKPGSAKGLHLAIKDIVNSIAKA